MTYFSILSIKFAIYYFFLSFSLTVYADDNVNAFTHRQQMSLLCKPNVLYQEISYRRLLTLSGVQPQA